MRTQNAKKFELTRQEKGAINAASVALHGKELDPLVLMNALCCWDDPPPMDERWERKLAAACEMAIGWCKQSQQRLIEIELLRKTLDDVPDYDGEPK